MNDSEADSSPPNASMSLMRNCSTSRGRPLLSCGAGVFVWAGIVVLLLRVITVDPQLAAK